MIVYLFFRDWLIAIRPLIIPVSLIGAFFIMYVSGFTINVLTLLAIVLATGLVVDDGIVVWKIFIKRWKPGWTNGKPPVMDQRNLFRCNCHFHNTGSSVSTDYIPAGICWQGVCSGIRYCGGWRCTHISLRITNVNACTKRKTRR
jgi:hypothetical protein